MTIPKVLAAAAVAVIISFIVISCSDMGDELTSTLAASTLSVQLDPGQQVVVQISGGVPPYVITDSSDASLASAQFVNSTDLVIAAPANVPIDGTTQVKISDSHADDDVPAGVLLHDDEITISITVSATPALVASTTLATVGLGQQVSIMISNGTPPYSVIEFPADTLATVAFVNANTTPATLVITGLAVAGPTSVRVGDSSPLAQREVAVQIFVTVAPSLTAVPPAVTAEPTQQVSVTISGGIPPYLISEAPASGIATATFVDANTTPATLVVTGVGSGGSTSVRILDSSPSPQREARVPITAIPTPPLVANPTGVTVGQGQAVDVAISNGTPPYAIALSPNSGLATAQIIDPNANPATLRITGVTIASVSGATSVRVRDTSPFAQRVVTVPITKVP